MLVQDSCQIAINELLNSTTGWEAMWSQGIKVVFILGVYSNIPLELDTPYLTLCMPRTWSGHSRSVAPGA